MYGSHSTHIKFREQCGGTSLENSLAADAFTCSPTHQPRTDLLWFSSFSPSALNSGTQGGEQGVLCSTAGPRQRCQRRTCYAPFLLVSSKSPPCGLIAAEPLLCYPVSLFMGDGEVSLGPEELASHLCSSGGWVCSS